MKTEPDYDVVDEEQDEPLFYDLTTEGNEDAWLDAAYEDRFDTGYEPEWEYWHNQRESESSPAFLIKN